MTLKYRSKMKCGKNTGTGFARQAHSSMNTLMVYMIQICFSVKLEIATCYKLYKIALK